MHIGDDLCQSHSECKQAKESTGCYEGEEVAIISTTNTVVKPETVMVLCFDAIVAHSAMMATWRSPDIASLAVLGWHFHSSRRRLGRLDQSPIVGRRSETKGILQIFRWRHWMEVSRQNLGNGQQSLTVPTDDVHLLPDP